MNMALLYILLLIFHISVVKSNGCSECTCEPSLNLLHCFGFNVKSWPEINNTTWIEDVTFINTLIQELPIFRADEYTNMNILKVLDCPFLDCNDIDNFQKGKPHVHIITDIPCTDTSTYSEQNSTYLTSTETIVTQSVFFTTMQNQASHFHNYWIIILSCLAVLIPILIGTICLYLFKFRPRSSPVAMIEMTEIF